MNRRSASRSPVRIAATTAAGSTVEDIPLSPSFRASFCAARYGLANDPSVILRFCSTHAGRVGVAEPGGSALGPLEAEAMAALWQADAPLSVREVVNRLNVG